MAMMPADLLGLEAADLVGRGHGGMSIFVGRLPRALTEGMRRKGCRLGAGRERSGAGGNTECDLQEISTFHASFL